MDRRGPLADFRSFWAAGSLGSRHRTCLVALCHFSKMVNLEKNSELIDWTRTCGGDLACLHHEKTYSLEDGYEMRCGSREAHCSHGDCFDVCSGASQDVGQVRLAASFAFLGHFSQQLLWRSWNVRVVSLSVQVPSLIRRSEEILPLRQATLPALCDPPHGPTARRRKDTEPDNKTQTHMRSSMSVHFSGHEFFKVVGLSTSSISGDSVCFVW